MSYGRQEPTSLKECTKCGALKPVCFGHFYRQAVTYDGYQSQCRACDTARSREQKRQLRAEGRAKKPSPEKARSYTQKWRTENLEKARHDSRIQQKIRRENVSYRLMANAGRRVRMMLKTGGGSTRHLPYSAEQLRTHLEKQFSKGMTWENYGSYWHVDHIVPVSSFSPKDHQCAEFIACWRLSNLRPLKAFDNMSKGKSQTHLL